MAKDRLDWFPFYADDFLFSNDVQAMSAAEKGLYVVLLALQWKSDRGLTDSMGVLSRISGVEREEFDRLWPTVSKKFTVNQEGLLVNLKLEEVRREQKAQLSARIEAGKAAAAKRWNKDSKPNGSLIAHPIALDKNRLDKDKEIKEPISSVPKNGSDHSVTSDSQVDDVAQFLEGYRVRHVRVTGAALPLVWSPKDCAVASEILKTWKLPRVLDMAELFMYHPEMKAKPKSLGWFKHYASWADETLKRANR